jgi:hypothetical protein
MNEKVATAIAVSVVILSIGVAHAVRNVGKKPANKSEPVPPTEDGRRTAEASIARLEKALSADKVSGINAAKKAVAYYKIYLATGNVDIFLQATQSEAEISRIED